MAHAYYNDSDNYVCDWLENLIGAGLIAPGDVDRRSIVDVRADDIRSYTQCHFFAGIGGWSYALRLAGWPDDRPVWTASLPCQPYSVASVAHGGPKGQGDARHLLPVFIPLVAEHEPAIIFGEQVASAVKWGWIDEAFGALEPLGYACGTAIVPAIAVGARHERKRLYWVADAGGEGRPGYQPVERLPVTAHPALAFNGDPLADAGRALDGDCRGLLLGDGLSVQLDRLATKALGNAIVPQVAAEFIGAYLDIARPRPGA